MKGRFIGIDSMGFVHGQIYDVRSEIKEIKNGRYSIGMCICLYDNFSDAWCPYSNLEALLANWDFKLGQTKIKALN